MSHITVSEARKNLYKLVDQVERTHEPTLIKGKRSSAVLISNEDWQDIVETLYVMQNESLTKSLIMGMKETYEECSTKLNW